MKIQIIRNLDAAIVMQQTNDFIKDKKVVDIKYHEYTVQEGNAFKGYELSPVTSVLIMYEDQDNQ